MSNGNGQAYTTSGQRPGTDDSWGADPTHQTYDQQGSSAQFSQGVRPAQLPSEIPAWSKDMMKNRGRFENNVDDTNQIFVTITVTGWQKPGGSPEPKPGGGLWEPGEMVDVQSDWLIMHRPLSLKAVTFTQDNESGTRSTLELVNDAASNLGNYAQPQGSVQSGGTEESAPSFTLTQIQQAVQNAPPEALSGVGAPGTGPGGLIPASAARTGQPYPQRAVIDINGEIYWEWQSVNVRLEAGGNPPRMARFTCSEQEGIGGSSFTALRIRPGDKCSIYLDTYLVLTGYVSTRQVYFDARQHAVEITAVGMTDVLSHGSVISQTGEWKNIPFTQLVGSLIGPYGLAMKPLGDVNKQPIQRANSMPGEPVKQMIERYANAHGIITGETADGSLALWGKLPTGGGATVIQGVNILIGRETIHNQSIAAGAESTPQPSGSVQQ